MMSIRPNKPFRVALAILVYLAGATFLAAIVSVAVVRLMPFVPEGVSQAILRKGPDKVMIRCLQGWLVLLLPWLLKRLDWRGWHDLGFSRVEDLSGRPGGLQLVRGFVFGLFTMGAAALAMTAAGARVAHAARPGALAPWALAASVLAALTVGFFEETLARGIFFRLLARFWGVVAAAVVGSAFFAIAHFVRADPAAFDRPAYWRAVVAVFQSTVSGLSIPPASALRALNLALLGGVLCAFVARTGTIWFSIGAHSGWVFCIRLNSLLTSKAEIGGWWGGLRADGTDSPWITLFMIAFLAGAAWWPRPTRAMPLQENPGEDRS